MTKEPFMRSSRAFAARILAVVIALALWLPGPVAAAVGLVNSQAGEMGAFGNQAAAAGAVAAPLNIDLATLSIGAGLGTAALKVMPVAPVVRLAAPVAMVLPRSVSVPETLFVAQVPNQARPAAAAHTLRGMLAAIIPTGGANGEGASSANGAEAPKSVAGGLNQVFDNNGSVKPEEDAAAGAEESAIAAGEVVALNEKYEKAAARRLAEFEEKVKQVKAGRFGLEIYRFQLGEGRSQIAASVTFEGKPLAPKDLESKLASGEISAAEWSAAQSALIPASEPLIQDLQAILAQNALEQEAVYEKTHSLAVDRAVQELKGQGEDLTGMPAEAVVLHKEFEKASAQRFADFEEGVRQLKSGPFGIQLRWQLMPQGLGSSFGLTISGQPLEARLLKSLYRAHQITWTEWKQTKQALRSAGRDMLETLAGIVHETVTGHEAVHRRMAGFVQGVFKEIKNPNFVNPDEQAPPNIKNEQLERLLKNLKAVDEAQQGSGIPRRDLMRLASILTQIDRHFVDPIPTGTWDKAVELMVDVAAKAFGVVKDGLPGAAAVPAVEAAAAKKDWDLVVTDMVKAMVEKFLDPFSVYWTQDEYKEFEDTMNNTFFGIGIGTMPNGVGITHVFPGSAAEKAGLKSGDKIIAVDGVPANGPDRKPIRGKEGTTVRVQVERDGQVLPEFSITRVRMQTRNVYSKMAAPEVGYVYLGEFSPDAGREVFAAIAGLREQGAKKVILDLRSNPGGSVSAAASIMASFFKDGQKLQGFKKQGRTMRELFADGDGLFSDMPVAVLINGGSASASEVVSGAIQDVRGAVVVGGRSYGKGSAQDVKPDRQGRALKLTMTRWYTPNDRNIDNQRNPETKEKIEGTGGIIPDHPVEMTQEQEIAVLRQLHGDVLGIPAGGPRVADPVLEKALEVLSR
jgi:carboxyl-terminal processing protease